MNIGILEKAKIESSNNDVTVPFNLLHTDILQRICYFLPNAKDILTFELLFEKAIQHTTWAWEECARKEFYQKGLNIEWPLSDKEHYREKAFYIHAKVLSTYTRSKIYPTNNAKNLFARFEGIMMRYPSSLGAYLWKDLNQGEKIDSFDKAVFTANPSISSNTSLTAGGLLLKGLSYLIEHTAGPDNSQKQALRRQAFASLSQAAQKGAACVSYLACQVLYTKYPVPEWYYNLACVSINKKDYLALELLLREFSILFGHVDSTIYAEYLYNMGIAHPPILVKTAHSVNRSHKEAEGLIDEAIKNYQGNVPASVWIEAFIDKHLLNKWDEAKNCLDQAIAIYNRDQIPFSASLWECLIYLRREQKKWKEAADAFDKAISAYDRENVQILATFYEVGAEMKASQQNWKEAKYYIDKALYTYKTENKIIPSKTWHLASLIYTKLYAWTLTKKPAEYEQNAIGLSACDYTNIALNSYTQENNIPFELWERIIYLYVNLSFWNLAERYFDKALKKIKKDKRSVPAELWVMGGRIKTNKEPILEELNKAEKYFKVALNIYEKDEIKVPADVYGYIADLKSAIKLLPRKLTTLQEVEEEKES